MSDEQMFEVPQLRLEELTTTIKDLRFAVGQYRLMAQSEKAKRLQAEQVIRAMWPVFCAAIDFAELSTGKLKSLQDTCGAMLHHGMDIDLLAVIAEIVGENGTKGGEE